MTAQAEVIVIGGGVVGASITYFTALKGAQVLLLEKSGLARGSTFASAGLLVPSDLAPMASPGKIKEGLRSWVDPLSAVKIRLRPDPGYNLWLLRFLQAGFSKKRFQATVDIIAEYNRDAIQVHQDLAAKGGEYYQFNQNGLLALFITEKAFQTAQEDTLNLAAAGLETKVLSRETVRELEPAAGPQVIGGILYPEDGQVKPGALVQWLTQEAEKLGATILTEAEVFGFRTSGRQVTAVSTTRGEFQAEQFVLAAGAWLKPLTRLLGRPLPIEAAKGYNLSYAPVAHPSQRPLMLEDKHVVASPYQDKFRLTSTLDLSGLNQSIDSRRLDLIQPMAELYLPHLSPGPVKEVRSGLRPCTPDGLPIQGRLPAWINVLAVGGHGQKGITWGPSTGRQVSRLLAGEPGEPWEKAFAPNRF